MTTTYATPIYLLAFDHRSSFERGLFGATPPVSKEVHRGIERAKALIFTANQLAVEAGAPQQSCGILVDEEFGANVARRAKQSGVPLAMPVERSGQDEFELEYGDDFAAHVEAFDPTFTKVLVRYNPGGDPSLNRRQAERLARLSDWLHAHGRLFLFELLVPPTTAQLEMFADHRGDYDRQLRPRLTVETLASLQAAGVEPDIWKVEGFGAEKDASAVVAQATSGGRDGVNCIVLGRGAGLEKVADWLRVGAQVDGFVGFAVGRTLWHDALADHLAGRTSEEVAARVIAERYRELIQVYDSGSADGGPP